jgi:hypothetical protein
MNRPETFICGSQKLLAGMRIKSGEQNSIILYNIPFNQVSGGFTDKHIAVVFPW